MASLTSMKVFFVLNFCLAVIVTAKTYNQDANSVKKDAQKPGEKKFRMNKINLLWEKAQKRISPGDLVKLYGDLVIQDGLEIEAKKQQMDGQDDNGERQALVRKKFLEILTKYNLNTEEDPRLNKVDPSIEQADLPTLEGDKKMEKRLATIWMKAQKSGFTDDELEELRSEFLHHQEKLDEFNQLKNEVDSAANGMDNNLTEMKDGESPQDVKEKKEALKLKWREIKDGYSDLETKKPGNQTFVEPKVAALWSLAQNANFTEIELESFKEELRHFENKVQKHDYLKKELAMNKMKSEVDDKAVDPANLNKLDQKVSDHSKKLKKIHHELNSRIKQKMEL